jgi:hypothetical protein
MADTLLARVGSRRAAVMIASALTVGALMAASVASAAPSAKPTITKTNDANHDGVYSASESLPKNASFPYTVSYQLTIFGGTASGPLGPFHIIRSITDDQTSDIGTCAALVGSTINVNETKTCTYSVSLGGPSGTLVNTATMVWDGGGNDTASSSSTVDTSKAKGKCNSGNGNGSDFIQFTDPTAHCYGGDPGNSYNAGNRGGDEIPTSGGNPNPGGNNVP